MFGAPNGYFGLGNQSMLQTQPDQQPKQGMFAGGNIGSAISAAIGGYLARTNPGASEAVLAPLQMKQQQMMLAQQADLASQRELQRQKDLYQFQLDNPKPTDPHYFQDNSGNEMAIGPDGKPVVVYKDPNPWKLVSNGLGGVVPVNMEALMNGGSASMPAPGTVVADPRMSGGPTPQASGGFPTSYPDIGPYHRY